MTSKTEIKKHLDIALREVGAIHPVYDNTVNAWTYNHPKYPVRYAGESKEEVIENYPLYLQEFIVERLSNNLSPSVEKRTEGIGGKI